MKKYMEFLLENDAEAQVELPTSQDNTEQNVESEEKVQPEIPFDNAKYKEIIGQVTELWSEVFTERNLNFKKDTDEELKSKLYNKRYQKYFNLIKDRLKKREQQAKQEEEEKSNITAQQTKIKDVIDSLVVMGNFNKRTTKKEIDFVKNLISENPNASVGQLVKLALKEPDKKVILN